MEEVLGSNPCISTNINDLKPTRNPTRKSTPRAFSSTACSRYHSVRMGSVLSFRPQIEKLTGPFSAHHSEAELFGSLLAELIVGISGYREEGVKNVPLLFLGPDLKEILIHLRGNDPVEIGSGTLGGTLSRTILKTCGPLAQNHEWAIYVATKNHEVHYGLFRTDRFPLHESTFQRLRGLALERPVIIGLQRIGEALVEIRSSSGRFHYIDFSGLLEISQNPAHLVLHWVAALTEDVPPNLKLKVESFYHRIAVEMLAAPHGTLAAVLRAGDPYPALLSDGVILNRSFGLSEAIRRYVKKRDEATALSLGSYASLIKKMLGMDGITVFNSSGDVLAYNCFVRNLHPYNPKEVILGGARKRAFEIMSKRIGHELTCTLYQSQDGYGQCRVIPALQRKMPGKSNGG